jgi:acetyl-CoA acetyltransferase
MKFEDLDIIELNEAFAVQAVGFMKHTSHEDSEDPRPILTAEPLPWVIRWPAPASA